MAGECVQNVEPVQPGKAGWFARFLTIWVGQALSLLGSQVAGFAILWWMTTTTGSAAILATGALIDSLPRVFVGPFAGALIDRWNRRRVLIVADGIVALAAAALVYLSWAGRLQIWHLYALGFVRSVCGMFHWVAMQASTSLLVPHAQLARVQGMNQTLNAVVNIAGPPLGALLLGVLSLSGTLAIDLSTAVLAIVPLCLVGIPQPEASEVAEGAGKPSMGQDIREGLRYLWDWKGLRTIVLVAIVCNLIMVPPMVLLPLLVTAHFGGGTAELASMQAAWPLGMMVGGLILGVWGGFRRKATSMGVGMMSTCASMLLVGFAPGSAFWLAWIGILTMGILNPFVNGPLMALMQTHVRPDMQGRVMATLLSLANAMTPLGLLIAGPLADHTGTRPWFLVAGVVSLAGGLILSFSPAVQHIEDKGELDSVHRPSGGHVPL